MIHWLDLPPDYLRLTEIVSVQSGVADPAGSEATLFTVPSDEIFVVIKASVDVISFVGAIGSGFTLLMRSAPTHRPLGICRNTGAPLSALDVIPLNNNQDLTPFIVPSGWQVSVLNTAALGVGNQVRYAAHMLRLKWGKEIASRDFAV